MNTKRILYGSTVSPFVRKVWIVLQLKNLGFELRTMIPFLQDDKKALLKLNPLGKIPVYQEDRFIIADSSAICAYLEKKYPEISVYPSEPEQYAQCLWYEEYADAVLVPAALSIFFNKLLAVKFGQIPDEKAIEHAVSITLPQIFAYLNEQVKGKKYLVGEKLSLADISITAPFVNLELASCDLSCKQYPYLSAYLNEITRETVIENSIAEVKEKMKV